MKSVDYEIVYEKEDDIRMDIFDGKIMSAKVRRKVGGEIHAKASIVRLWDLLEKRLKEY